MSRDSAFALGTAVRYLKYPDNLKNIKYNEMIYSALKYLREAEYLPVSMIAILLGCSRSSAQKLMAKMWQARLVKCIEIATYSTPSMTFKLWVNSVSGMPKNANEACRLAVLGAFYGRIKKEQAELEWIIVKRSKEKKQVTATMAFVPAGKKDKVTLTVDAPRRGEKPNPDADIYIFPTTEEAKLYTPPGKRFTTDLVLMNRNIETNNLISDPVEK